MTLLLAAVLSWHAGDYRLAFGVLAVPGVVVLALLLWLYRRVPDPTAYENIEPRPSMMASATGSTSASEADLPGSGVRRRAALPPLLWQYVAAIAVLSCGIASFPLLAFHAQTQGLLTEAQIPVLFALAMLVDGLSGLVMGRVYDRRGPRVLLVVPVAASVAAIAFTHSVLLIWIGVAIWVWSTASWAPPSKLLSRRSFPLVREPPPSAGSPSFVALVCWWPAESSAWRTTTASPW